MIKEFKNQYFFLSNFYECPVYYNKLVFCNAEAAFQAQKVIDEKEQYKFINLNASQARKLGKTIVLREDWEEVKDNIMYEIVKRKFTVNKELQQKLIGTKDEELVEGNWCHDTYWGVDSKTGIGKNKLGKILMKVREEVKSSNAIN